MRKAKFLLDANLSPETAIFLRSFGFDGESLIEEGISGLDDAAVARRAANEKRVLITFDLDLGELYYFTSARKFSAIVLRLNDQRIENANSLLREFLTKHYRMFTTRKEYLVILSEAEARIVE